MSDEILKSLGIERKFEGRIRIDRSKCRGIECRLCLNVCPTNALFWSTEIGLVEELCIHCTACTLACMVDDCIRVERTRIGRRDEGKEVMKNPRDVLRITDRWNARKQIRLLRSRFV